MKLVRTPEPGHTGEVGKVRFVDGVARVADDAQEMHYFRSAGYAIEDFEDVLDQVGEDDANRLIDLDTQSGTPEEVVRRDVDGDGVVDALPKRSASTEEWRTFATAHGMSAEEANSTSRDELVAHFYEEGGQ